MKWEVIDTHVNSAAENMRLDDSFLKKASFPLIHFYQWEKPCATYGHFIEPENYFLPSFETAKRPTGGGIIFHLNDFSFSIVIPATHSLYQLPTIEKYHSINQSVATALEKIMGKTPSLLHTTPSSEDPFLEHFCMAHPTKYDLMLNNRKVGGAAQRKTKQGFLHQCSINLYPDDSSIIERAARDPTLLISAFEKGSTSLFNSPLSEANHIELRKEIQINILSELNRRDEHENLQK